MKPFAILTSAIALFAVHANGAVSVNPYMYIGRIADARHAGFDGKRQATFRVTSEDGGTVLVNEAATYLNPRGRDNYNLKIPMANEAADGCAVKGQAVNIVVTDNAGKKWSGVVADSTVGDAGGVREVDIVLGTDENGDGIDDGLFSELEAQWEDSDCWAAGETFDPCRDYDGDGVSTLDEAFSGTDPFDPDDCLKIVSYVRSAADGDALTFTARAGRLYSVMGADSLGVPEWSRVAFSTDETEDAECYTQPNDVVRRRVTVYLYPDGGKPSAFYRIVSE